MATQLSGTALALNYHDVRSRHFLMSTSVGGNTNDATGVWWQTSFPTLPGMLILKSYDVQILNIATLPDFVQRAAFMIHMTNDGTARQYAFSQPAGVMFGNYLQYHFDLNLVVNPTDIFRTYLPRIDADGTPTADAFQLMQGVSFGSETPREPFGAPIG